MHTPFGVPFDDLTVEDLKLFLLTASDESVTWEGKGEGALAPTSSGLKPDHVARSVCAFANQIGGYLTVGAERPTGDSDWQLPGIARTRTEPRAWIDEAASGLRPPPRYRHRVLEMEDDRWCAVVLVEPLTQTPCMTAQGEIFERVSGESRKVTDPSRLAELQARGSAARELAESATRALFIPPSLIVSEPRLNIILRTRATSYEPEPSRAPKGYITCIIERTRERTRIHVLQAGLRRRNSADGPCRTRPMGPAEVRIRGRARAAQNVRDVEGRAEHSNALTITPGPASRGPGRRVAFARTAQLLLGSSRGPYDSEFE